MAKFKAMWNGFWCYRYLLWNLVSRDFKLKYRRSVLGVVWPDCGCPHKTSDKDKRHQPFAQQTFDFFAEW